MNTAQVISFCGRIPLLGASLRRIARRYPENSVTTIRNGHLAGYRWRRSHRYVSGYWLGIYELPIQECLVRELKPGDVFYDIGANAGFFTLLGSKCVGPRGRVFSFEPLPENIRSVRAQLQLNDAANCEVVDAAVADRAGTVEFYEGEDTSTAHLKRADRGDAGAAAIAVRAIRLDEFVATSPVPDFIKMDIEGAELAALRGADGLLHSENPPKILIEFHGEALRRDGLALLRECGYRFGSLDGIEGEESSDRHILCVPHRGSGYRA